MASSERREEVQRLDDEEALAAVRAFVAESLGQQHDVEVAAVAVRGRQASEALIDAARDADLLVVGARGVGGISGAVLGSVSEQCVSHARCPVVIVREKHGSDVRELTDAPSGGHRDAA